MWLIAKIKKNETNFFKFGIKEKCGEDLILYQPIIECEKFINNRIRRYNKAILEDYFFCYSKQFQNQIFLNNLKNIKGLKYFLGGHLNNQKDIIKFINNCKKHENKYGFISPSFFFDIISSKAKFVSGPFTNMLFEVLEKNKNKFKVLIGKYKVSFSAKERNLYYPI